MFLDDGLEGGGACVVAVAYGVEDVLDGEGGYGFAFGCDCDVVGAGVYHYVGGLAERVTLV